MSVETAAIATTTTTTAREQDSTGVPATFTVASHLLHWLLKAASEFAGRDKSLPMINVVHLEISGDTLLAVATDRFVLGVAKAPISRTGVSDGPLLDVTVGDVKTLLPLLKVAKRDEDTTVTVTVDDGVLHLLRSDGIAARVTDAKVQFISWRYLIGTVRGSEPVGELQGFGANIDPAKLVKFTRVRRYERERMTIEPNRESSHRPVTIRVGENFVGIMMSLRAGRGEIESDSYAARAAWDAVL